MKARYVVIAVLCAAAIGWMVVLLQRNVVFFKTVSVAVADREPVQLVGGLESFRVVHGDGPKGTRRRQISLGEM